MDIGILGTGAMGSGLGRRWAGRGHQVMFGSRDPQKARDLAESIGPYATVGTIAHTAQFGEAVLLAVRWANVPEIIQAAGSLAGKILMDCTNPLEPGTGKPLIGHTTSAAEEIAKLAQGAKVVKAFNHLYAQLIHTGPQFGARLSTFYCGDDAVAKVAVARLIEDVGFEAIDAGPLYSARYLEPLAALMGQLAYGLGMGTDLGIKLIRRYPS